MIVVRLRSKEEHHDILKKVKKMKKFAEELEECLEDVIDEEFEDDYREESHRYEDEPEYRGGRYSYRRGGGSRMSRM